MIHGSGHGVLAHASTAYFPPIEDDEAEWMRSTVADDDNIRVWIRCIETYSPTAAPTAAPTESESDSNLNNPATHPRFPPSRLPTASGDIYDGHLDIIFVLTNPTEKNFAAILSVDTLDAVRAIIETHYVSELLPSLEFFVIDILELNRIQVGAVQLANLSSHDVLYLRSSMSFQHEYAFYLESRSGDVRWHWNVTMSFRAFFDNALCNFSVANASALSAAIQMDASATSLAEEATFSILNAFLALCVAIAIVSALYNCLSLAFAARLPSALAPTDSGWSLSLVYWALIV